MLFTFAISVSSMSLDKLPLVTEEPYSGWLRYEIEGQRPWFKTPVPRIVIRNTGHLQEYLRKEHDKGNLLDINENGREGWAYAQNLHLATIKGYC